MLQYLPIFIAILVGLAIFGIIYFLKKKDDNKIKPDTSNRKPIKKALLVGINKYPPEMAADLKGCINDVENMHNLLTTKFGFDSENIRTVINERATKQGILDRLKWLLDDTKAGDELVFHYSGHGSQVRDRNGDELDDHLDEILCPYDLDWDDPLTDDDLAILFKQLPNGVYLTMICDACHSGTMTRSVANLSLSAQNKSILPPFDIRLRSMNKTLLKNTMGKKDNKGSQRHVLMSGCKDNQTSSDAFIDGKYQGAFTWALTRSIRENPYCTWSDIHKLTVNLLSTYNYNQIPQISGDKDLISRKVFGE